MIGLQITPGTVVFTGVWCPRCLLPSAVLVPLHNLNPEGLTTFGTFTYCPGCRGCPEMREI
jgi:hypothetical protein